MAALRTEFEQRFTEVLTSRAVAAPRGAMRALDPHPGRRPEQDGRSPPRRHRRDPSPATERLPRRPGGLRQQLELHDTARPSRGAKSASRRTGNGSSQPPVDTIRGGEDYASAIVRGSYRSVCHRCSPGSSGVDPEHLEQFSAENTARLAPSLARPAKLRTGAIARSTSRFPYRPCAGLPHRTGGLECASMSEGPTNGWTSHHGGTLRRLALPCGSCGWRRSVPLYHRCQPRNRVTTARGTLWSITCHQDYLSGEDRIPCPPKTLAVAPSP
jgi:hypothetical protein